MYRLSALLIRSVEDALSTENAAPALGLLVHAMESHRPTVDGLRLAALCARQLGDEEAVEALLRSAHMLARAQGDLVGAVDALRRLDALSVETERDWGAFLHQVATYGFTGAVEPAEHLPPKRSEPAKRSIAALLADARALSKTPQPTPERPFSAIPLLSALPVHELSALLRSLQLRVAPSGTPVLKVSNGAPAWITSGSISHRTGSTSPAIGSLVLPGEEGPTADTPVRLVALPKEIWDEYRELDDITRPLQALAKHSLLIDTLRNSPFYRGLTPSARQGFLQQIQCATLRNEPIIKRGEPVRGLFVLISGHAGIIDASHDTPTEIATLHAGDVFGEYDVLTAAGAAYDVVAKGEVNICLLQANHARALLESDPQARRFLVNLHDQRNPHNALTNAPAEP